MTTTKQNQKETQAPDPKEIISIIENEAYYRARQQMAGMEFASVDPDRKALTINRNTPWQTVIRLNGDGTVTVPDDLLEMPLRSSPNPVFQNALNHLTAVAEWKLQEHVHHIMGEAAGRSPEQEQIAECFQKTAQGVCSHTGMGYIRNPARAGNHLLHQLLSKEAVSETLRMTGAKATISDLNLVAQHRETLNEAHQRNPNALVLWMNQVREHGAKCQTTPSPDRIIAEAKSFIKLEFPDTANPESVWKAFCNLNRKAVNDYFHNTAALYYCVGVAAATGRQPSYSAIKLIALNYDRVLRAPEAMNKAFLLESERRCSRQQGTQAELCQQMEALLNAPDPAELRLEVRGPEQLMTRWSVWAKLSQNYSKPAPRPHVGKESSSWDENAQQKLAELVSENLNRISAQVDRALRVEGKPGKRAALKGPDGDIIVLERRSSGTLKPTGTGYFTGYLTLPAPLEHTGNDAGDQGNITTRGRAAKLAGEIAVKMMSGHWNRGDMPSNNRIKAALERAKSGIPEDVQLRNDDQELTRQLRAEVAELLDAEAWQRAKTAHGRVTVEKYNQEIKKLNAERRSKLGERLWKSKSPKPTSTAEIHITRELEQSPSPCLTWNCKTCA